MECQTSDEILLNEPLYILSRDSCEGFGLYQLGKIINGYR